MSVLSVLDIQTPFKPWVGLRHAHMQTLLASSPWRRFLMQRRARSFLSDSDEWIVEAGSGVRLQGYYSARTGARSLVLMLHGWEGSAESNYILSAGSALYAAGHSIFRLNFRDHGESHHLNPGIFHSCLLEEVVGALAAVRRDLPDYQAVYLLGFSLGGNFALRVTLQAPAAGLDLSRTLAVCPVIIPADVLTALENGFFLYRHYFDRKWERSIRVKQGIFPDNYAYADWFSLATMRERTAFFATRYYNFASLEDYLDGYAIGGRRLQGITTPTTIVTAQDDPVVPVKNFESIAELNNIRLLISRYGGHCGFLKNPAMDSWIDEFATREFRLPT